MSTDSDGLLANVEAVLRVYAAKLEVACRANRDDHRFLSGVTHAQVALERVRRALDGESDPVRLGLADPETASPAPDEAPGLFDTEKAAS